MKELHRSIFFTKIPIDGYYRYKDEFQFFPANLENQPESKYQKHFINILEFWTDKDEVVNVPEGYEGLESLYEFGVKQVKKSDDILNLISSILNNQFFTYKGLEGNWAIPLIEEDIDAKKEDIRSQWCLNLFSFPELADQLKISEFSDLSLPEIIKVPHQKFYMYDPNVHNDKKKPLTLPDSIERVLDGYYFLSPENRFYVDSAVSYCSSAVELLEKKKTLSLLSSFTAMETMVNLEYIGHKAERCDACGLQKYSVSKKFREFLLKYIGDSKSNKKKFNKYYSLRSKIVHTGSQLKSEKLFAEFPDEELDTEYLQRLEILQLGKLAIVNWLIFNHEGVIS